MKSKPRKIVTVNDRILQGTKETTQKNLKKFIMKTW